MQDSDKSFSLRWETYQNQHTNLRSKCCLSCDILHTKLGMVPNHPKKTHCHSFLFLFNETKHSLFMLVNLVHYLLFPYVQHWDRSEPLSSKDFPFGQRLSEKTWSTWASPTGAIRVVAQRPEVYRVEPTKRAQTTWKIIMEFISLRFLQTSFLQSQGKYKICTSKYTISIVPTIAKNKSGYCIEISWNTQHTVFFFLHVFFHFPGMPRVSSGVEEQHWYDLDRIQVKQRN